MFSITTGKLRCQLCAHEYDPPSAESDAVQSVDYGKDESQSDENDREGVWNRG
jgi:hypothetical protein